VPERLEAPLEHRLRMFLVLFGFAFALWCLLVEFRQLPDLPNFGRVGGIGLSVLAVMWARVQYPDVSHALVRKQGGLWLFLLGPVTFPYYLFATRQVRSRARSLSLLASYLAPVVAITGAMIALLFITVKPRYLSNRTGQWVRITRETARGIVARDFRTIGEFVSRDVQAGHSIPESADDLYRRIDGQRANWNDELTDPYSGGGYYYVRTDTSIVLWSTGPDGLIETRDDLSREFIIKGIGGHVAP
jgi:hypothetical protein